jgi:hypothetical protein
MAYIDDYFARIGGMGMTPTNASPYTSPQSFRSAFGTTPVNIGGMSGLPGGTAPIAKTTGISPMRGIGFGGIATPSTPSMPPRGFGTRIADLFKDQSKFADALTGLALITGTPSDRALGIRQALQPTTSKSSSIGTILNVYDENMKFVRQITSKDQALADQYLNQGYTVLPAGDASQLGAMGIERADLDDGQVRFVDDTGEVVTKFDDNSKEAQEVRNEIITAQNEYDGLIDTITEQINDLDAIRDIRLQFDTTLSFIGFLKGQEKFGLPGLASDANRLLDQVGTNVFIQAINDMRAASKTGGAVGQVTEKEMAAFRNSKFDLAPENTNLISELERAKTYYTNYLNRKLASIKANVDNLNKQLITTQEFTEKEFTTADDASAQDIINSFGG